MAWRRAARQNYSAGNFAGAAIPAAPIGSFHYGMF
jgi:hypothetical protein